MRGFLGIVATVLVLGGAGCSSVPAPADLTGWNVGDSRAVGNCEFRLLNASFFHSTSWNVRVTMRVTNTGSGATRCGWSGQLISGNNRAVTDAAGVTRTFSPGETDETLEMGAEANITGYSNGPGGSEWVLTEINEGIPFVGDSAQFHTQPARVRPPS